MDDNVETMDPVEKQREGVDPGRARRVGRLVADLRGERKQEAIAISWQEAYGAAVGGNTAVSRIESGDVAAVARAFVPWGRKAEALCSALGATDLQRAALQRELRGRPLVVIDAASFGARDADTSEVLKQLSQDAKVAGADVITVVTSAREDAVPRSLAISPEQVVVVEEDAVIATVLDRAGHAGVIVSARWHGPSGVPWPIERWIAARVHPSLEHPSYGYEPRPGRRDPARLEFTPEDAFVRLAKDEPIGAPLAVTESLLDLVDAQPLSLPRELDAVAARRLAIELARHDATPKEEPWARTEDSAQYRAGIARTLGVPVAVREVERAALHVSRACRELEIKHSVSDEALARDRVRFGLSAVELAYGQNGATVFTSSIAPSLTASPYVRVEHLRREESPVDQARTLLRARTLDQWISDPTARDVVAVLARGGLQRVEAEHVVAQELSMDPISVSAGARVNWRDPMRGLLDRPVPPARVLSYPIVGLDLARSEDEFPVVAPIVLPWDRAAPTPRSVTFEKRHYLEGRAAFAPTDRAGDLVAWLEALHRKTGRSWSRTGASEPFATRWADRDTSLGAVWLELRGALGGETIDLPDGRGLVRLRRSLYVVVEAHSHDAAADTAAWIREPSNDRRYGEAPKNREVELPQIVVHGDGFALHLTTRRSPWREFTG